MIAFSLEHVQYEVSPAHEAHLVLCMNYIILLMRNFKSLLSCTSSWSTMTTSFSSFSVKGSHKAY